MTSSFREQISEKDCVPTSILNAFSHLFERKEIPSEVIQRTYLYCLDSQQGTTDLAVKLLCNWLNEYRHNVFSVSAEFYEGDRVHLGRGNPISQCLNRGGAALLKVTHQAHFLHYILCLGIDDGWIHCFDPYPRTTRSNKTGRYEFMLEGELGNANLRIASAWLGASGRSGQFRLGSKQQRSCLLIDRHGA
jgi:hypothetical protein